jgi:hypothetical protein
MDVCFASVLFAQLHFENVYVLQMSSNRCPCPEKADSTRINGLFV